MKQVINGKTYDTETAAGVASNHYWDGGNWERNGRNTFLYKTKKGNFFIHCITLWQGERNRLELVDIEEAKEYYEQLPEQNMSYEDAFGVEPEEA